MLGFKGSCFKGASLGREVDEDVPRRCRRLTEELGVEEPECVGSEIGSGNSETREEAPRDETELKSSGGGVILASKGGSCSM